MPLYEYVCDACGHRFEIIQKFSDAAPEACPACGKGPVVRQFSSPAIQFKGSGFYITDYAHKEKGPLDRRSAESGGGDKSEGAKADGSKADGSKTEGARTDGAKTDSGKTEKTKSDTSKTDSGTTSGTAAKSDAPAPSKSDKTTSSKD